MTAHLDLLSLNAPMQAAIEAALLRVARSGRYVLGPEVESFEVEWAQACGVRECVGTGNATDALTLALLACGVGPGDEVIVPSNTYIATWLSVTHAGAVPVPVEPDPATYNIDPARIEAALTPRTRAIVAVHLYGRCAPMDEINAIAWRNGELRVLEDCAQAHGAYANGQAAGSLSHAAAWSFYPTKNLGALGDAGAVTTPYPEIAAQVRRLRNYGRSTLSPAPHTVCGRNSRLDEIQAAVLRAKLPYLSEMNRARRERAKAYLQALKGLPGLTLPEFVYGHAWHQFVVRSRKRDAMREWLARNGVETAVHYPVPPHREPVFWDERFLQERQLDGWCVGRAEGYPIAERLAAEVLSLPIGNDIDAAAVGSLVAQSLFADKGVSHA